MSITWRKSARSIAVPADFLNTQRNGIGRKLNSVAKRPPRLRNETKSDGVVVARIRLRRVDPARSDCEEPEKPEAEESNGGRATVSEDAVGEESSRTIPPNPRSQSTYSECCRQAAAAATPPASGIVSRLPSIYCRPTDEIGPRDPFASYAPLDQSALNSDPDDWLIPSEIDVNRSIRLGGSVNGYPRPKRPTNEIYVISAPQHCSDEWPDRIISCFFYDIGIAFFDPLVLFESTTLGRRRTRTTPNGDTNHLLKVVPIPHAIPLLRTKFINSDLGCSPEASKRIKRDALGLLFCALSGADSSVDTWTYS